LLTSKNVHNSNSNLKSVLAKPPNQLIPIIQECMLNLNTITNVKDFHFTPCQKILSEIVAMATVDEEAKKTYNTHAKTLLTTGRELKHFYDLGNQVSWQTTKENFVSQLQTFVNLLPRKSG